LRSGWDILGLDRVALHERFHQASGIVRLGRQSAVLGLDPAQQSDLSQCFFGSHGTIFASFADAAVEDRD
jgi:hypothetical protein